VVEPPETPFTTKKEIRRGEISKNKAKGFSGGANGRVRPQALGLSLHGSAILLEIGSSFVVYSHQERTIFGEVAHSGGFFAGGAQRLPVGFQGGDLKLPPRQVGVLFCFLAAKAAPLRGTIKEHTN